ncbi:hypothetical protein V6Z12_D05G324300 [Gossypium hirsutum]
MTPRRGGEPLRKRKKKSFEYRNTIRQSVPCCNSKQSCIYF